MSLDMKRYLFYDIETSGLNPAFDQVLTFAAIITNLNLEEIERHSITIRLRPDIIPSPHAFITHRLTLDELAKGVCEYDAALKIHSLLNDPDTQSIGYNSLKFDDEFLRFLFYRNLLDPYSHQYASGCSRGDILPITALYRIFCPESLAWPRLEDGRSSLRLEHLRASNGFDISGMAHEAMADVEALIALTKLLQAKSDVWAYAMGFFDKSEDMRRHAQLEANWAFLGQNYRVALMVSPVFGTKCNYLAPVLCLGQSSAYKNQTLWLRLDREDLFAPDPDDPSRFQWYVIRKKMGDEWLLLPKKERFWMRLQPDVRELVARNLNEFIGQSKLFFNTLSHHLDYRYPDIPNIDVDASLYEDGFFSFHEKKEMNSFHQCGTVEDKVRVTEKMAANRIRNIAGRILMRNFSVPHGKVSMLDEINPVGIGYRGGELKYTKEQAKSHIEELLVSSHLDGPQIHILESLRSYLS